MENETKAATEAPEPASESPQPQTSECEPQPTFSPLRPSGKCVDCGAATDRWCCEPCDEKIIAKQRELAEREQLEAIDRELWRSGLPRDYVTGDRNARDIPVGACAGIGELLLAIGSREIPGLFLFGPSQSYKTTVAAAFLSGAIRAEKSGRFVDVTDLMTDIQRSYRDDDFDSRGEIVDRYAMTPLLVMDDLGQEKASHHAGEVLRQILDRRRRNWSPGRWLIVTSNFTPEELRDRFEEPQTGNAILHRIAQLTVSASMETSPA